MYPTDYSPIGLQLLGGQRYVLARGGARQQRHAQRIASVLLNGVQRVNHIACSQQQYNHKRKKRRIKRRTNTLMNIKKKDR